MIQVSEQEYERLRRAAGFMGSPTANRLIDVADDFEAEIAGYRAQLPADADGQTVALLEKAAERVSEAARLLRTVAAREGRRAETVTTKQETL